MRGTNTSIVVLAAVGCLSACSAPEPPASTERQREPVAVRVERIQATEQASVYEAVGTVRAMNSAQISSRIASYIRQLHADTGDRVRQGQVLAELDDRDLVSHLDQARAAKTEVEDAIQEAAYALDSAQAQLELAEVTHKRFEDLLGKKSVSQHEYDEVNARLRAARAGVEMASARKRQAEAKWSQVEAQITTAEVGLGYARILAPFDGVVVERLMDAGTQAAPGMPILVIDQAGRYRLDATLPETRLSALRVGETVAVRIEALGEPLEGRIAEVVPAVDPGSRTAIVKISLPPAGGLRSGMFGRALLAGGAGEPVLTVPEEAVVRRGQLQSVFVVEGNVARRRLVSLGSPSHGRYAVLSGLSGGEQVILNPNEVEDGGLVRASEAAPGGQS